MLLGPDGKPIKFDKNKAAKDIRREESDIKLPKSYYADQQKRYAEVVIHCMRTSHKIQKCGLTNQHNIWARRRLKGGYVLFFDIWQGMAFCPDPELKGITEKESFNIGAKSFAGLIKQWVVGALEPPHIIRLLVPSMQRKVMMVTKRMPIRDKGAQTKLQEDFEQRANLRKQGFDPQEEGLK